MKPMVGLLLLMTVVGYSAEVTCNLEGLRIDGAALPFGKGVEIIVHDPKPQDWMRLTPISEGKLFTVVEIGGREIETPLEILAFGELPEKFPENHCFRLQGHFGDAYSFGGEIYASFKTTHLEDNGKAEVSSQGVPPNWEELDGKHVVLSGRAISMSNSLCLEVGDLDVHLGDATGRPASFPSDWHYRGVVVEGLLRRQLRLAPRDRNDDEGLKLRPVIFNAVVRLVPERCPADLSDDASRFRQLFPMSPVRKKGVFDLLPEDYLFKNIMGGETKALSYFIRNRPWLMDTVRTADSLGLDVLAGRVADTTRDPALRILEAGVLAARNDPRGRQFLTQRLADLEKPDPDALFVLGGFYEWSGEKNPDVAWAVDLAIRCMEKAPLEAVRVSGIPEFLVKKRSTKGIQLIAELIKDEVREEALNELLNFERGDSVLLDALLEGDKVSVSNGLLVSLLPEFKDDSSAQLRIGEELLERDAVEALDLLLPKIAEEWWDIEFRDSAGSKILAILKQREPSLEGKALEAVNMVLLHHSDDAVPKLIQRLENPATPIDDFNKIRWQLDQLENGKKAAVALARFIHKRILPSGKEPDFGGHMVIDAIRQIGASSDDGAIEEMIILLGCDFSVLSCDIFPEKLFRETVADQLAQMTGASFGTDVSRWQKWFEKRGR